MILIRVSNFVKMTFVVLMPIVFSILLVLLTFFPGRMIADLLPLDDDEKFVSGFGISIFISYLAGFTTYVYKTPLINYAVLAGIAFSIILYFVTKKSLSIFRDMKFLGIVFLAFFFIVCIQTLLPFYSGGLWYFDWWEHYGRTLFFLDRQPPITYIGPYLLTARPPLFNAAAAFYQFFFGRDFYVYQIVASLFNLLPVLPAFLLVRHFLHSERKSSHLFLLVVSMLVLIPSVIAESTYTWTKALTAYYVLQAVYFYLIALKSRKPLPFILTGIFLSAGYLTHYSAAPYALIIFTDFFLRMLFSKAKLLPAFIISVFVFVCLASTWLIWAYKTYGYYQTFFGNTTYEWQQGRTKEWLRDKNITNLYYTLIPALPTYHTQTTNLEETELKWYDNIFSIYSVNLWGTLTFSLTAFGFFLIFVKLKRLQSLITDKKISILKVISHPYFFLVLLSGSNILFGPALNPLPIGGIAHITLITVTVLFLCEILSHLYGHKRLLPKILTVSIIVIFLLESSVNLALRIHATRVRLYTPIFTASYTSIIQDHLKNFQLKNDKGLVSLSDTQKGLDILYLVPLITLWLFFAFQTSRGTLTEK